jgi:hypothetical protein
MPLQVRSLAESIATLGLGSWRLRGRMSKPFERLAAVIEGTWREAFDMELGLHSLPEASTRAAARVDCGLYGNALSIASV